LHHTHIRAIRALCLYSRHSCSSFIFFSPTPTCVDLPQVEVEKNRPFRCIVVKLQSRAIISRKEGGGGKMMRNSLRIKRLWQIAVLFTIMSLASCNRGYALSEQEEPEHTIELEILAGATISAGNMSSFAIQENGTLWAWGDNQRGQLGIGMMLYHIIPSPVKVMDNVVSVSGGMAHTMAITTEGYLWGWGSNFQGQIGDGTTEDRFYPVKIMSDVVAVSAGSLQTFAIRGDGSLWAWGLNAAGWLGDGTTENRLSPVHIMNDVVAVSAGTTFAMAVTTDGGLWTWGQNFDGVLGDNSPIWEEGGRPAFRHTPKRILDDVIAISAHNHALAVKSDGSLWAWGNNQHGQLGNGVTSTQMFPNENLPIPSTPTKIMDNVSIAVAGPSFTFAITNDNTLWAWGYNDGYHGDATEDTRLTPVSVMENVAMVSVGGFIAGSMVAHVLAVKTDGSLWAWGDNVHGQIGTGEVPAPPTSGRLSSPVQIMNDLMLP
jgi:alpha-tubulin suppressor-like RCC1 family protein